LAGGYARVNAAVQAAATRRFIRKVDQIEGDDTCELLLQEIWRN